MMNEINAITNLMLYDDYCVRLELYEQVLTTVREAVVSMPPRAIRTAKALCGRAFWSGLSKADRIAAGRCVAYAVERQLVDLDFAVCPFAHPKRYVRRGDTTACFAKCSRFPS